MGLRCSPQMEASAQHPECHSISLDFNSSKTTLKNLGYWHCCCFFPLHSQPLAVVTTIHTHTHAHTVCLVHGGMGSDLGAGEMVVEEETPQR